MGGHTSLKNADAIDYNYILIRQTFLKSITHDFFLGLGYNLDYHWNITEAGNSDGSISDFQKYGFANKSSSSGITFNILYDTRRNPLNPPKGYYANIIFRSNFIPIGSDKNWQSVLLDFRKYFKLSSHSNNVLAVWSYNWFTLNGTPPYLDLPSTAWDTYSNQGRGYIQSRFRGKNLIALEAEYRFGITSNGLFGGVIFTNAQSVSEFQKNNFEVICPGAGAGMRIKVNKHSDTNVAIDYAVGNGGSRGFFVNLGEVF